MSRNNLEKIWSPEMEQSSVAGEGLHVLSSRIFKSTSNIGLGAQKLLDFQNISRPDIILEILPHLQVNESQLEQLIRNFSFLPGEKAPHKAHIFQWSQLSLV